MMRQCVTCLICVGWLGAALFAAEKPPVTVHVMAQTPMDVLKFRQYDPDTIKTAEITYRQVIPCLEKAQDFTFMAGQVPLLEPLGTLQPDLWKRMTQLSREGRIAMAGRGFVRFAGIGPCGESIVRQFLNGSGFFKAQFGAQSRVCWRVGAGAHPATLPQILKQCGMDSCFIGTGGKPGISAWTGLDGTRILLVKPVVVSDPSAFSDAVGTALKEYGHGHAAVLVNQDAWTPKKVEALKQALSARGKAGRFSHADAFAAALNKTDKNALPQVKGSLQHALPGVYTSVSAIKNGNRTAENLLLTAERFAAVASRYQPYPASSLRMAWGMTLFNQYHAVFGGSLVPAAAENALELYDQVERLTKPLFDEVLKGLAAHMDTRGMTAPVVVFNPLSWERDGIVQVPAPPGDAPWLVRDVEGRLLRTQVVYDAERQVKNLLFVARQMPPFGYRLYSLVPAPKVFESPCRTDATILETPGFKAVFHATQGDLTQVTDKTLGWDLLTGKGNQITVQEDLGDANGRIALTGRTFPLGPVTRMEVLEKGPVRVGMRIYNNIIGEYTTLVREIYLVDGLPWVDCRTHIAWNGQQKMVRTGFPLAVGAKTATWSLPFGSESHPNDGAERGALKWVDVSGEERGVALLNGNRHGYAVQGNVIRLSLLRSPVWPAHNDESGNHSTAYALYPHVGDCHAGKVWRRAWEYNIPLIAVPVKVHAGALPAQTSFFWLSQPNVMIAACKQAEDGQGIVLRLVEMEGRNTPVTLHSYWFLRGAFEADCLEQVQKKLPTQGDALQLNFKAHEIKTVVLKNWGFAPVR